MKNFIYTIAIGIMFLSACSDDTILDRKERRLTGTWEIERATYKEDWELFRDNVMGFYQDDQITFDNDFYAYYEDNSLRSVFDGEWGLILERDADDDKTIFIEMIFYDSVNNEEIIYFAEITFLTHRKLKMTVITDDGTYRFKLLKK